MDMTTQGIVQHVNSMFVDLFELEESRLVPAANLFADLGLDSLDAIDLVLTCERKLNIHLEQNDVRALRTLQDVYDLLERHARSATADTADSAAHLTPPVASSASGAGPDGTSPQTH